MDAAATQTRPPKVAGKASTSEPAVTAASEAPAAKPIGQVSPEKTVLAEYAGNCWRTVAPRGAMPDDLDMADGPFNLIAKDLSLHDDIRVIASDSTWLADYIVVDCAATWAVARLTQAINLPVRRSDLNERIPPGFRVIQAGPSDSQAGWLIWRDDGVMLNAGYIVHKKEDAVAFLVNHPTVRGDNNPRYFGKPATA